MRKIFLQSVFTIVLMAGSFVHSNAQLPVVEVIREGIKKVIRAVDLHIQRLQNETIWLQNVQKTLENQMTKLRLEEISGWVRKHKDLYEQYFDELLQVKAALSYYKRVTKLLETQRLLINEYRSAWLAFNQDTYFTKEERNTMSAIYSGILSESSRQLEGLDLVLRSFTTSMSDAARLQLIDGFSDQLDRQLAELRQYNTENRILSLQRHSARKSIDQLKKHYGIK